MAGRGRRQPAAAGAWWTSLKPGDSFEAEYEDDGVAHMRLALWPISPTDWMVRSPDGDEWPEDVSGHDGATGPCLTRSLRTGAGRGLPPLYRFREELDGRELKSAVVRGLKAAVALKPLADTPRCCCLTMARRRSGWTKPLGLASTRSCRKRWLVPEPQLPWHWQASPWLIPTMGLLRLLTTLPC